MNMTRALLLLGMVIVPTATGCDAEQPPPPPVLSEQPASVEFDTATVTFSAGGRSIPMRVEVAQRQEQRAVGLMDRDSLSRDAGMVFLYDDIQPAGTSFWMYNTRIPLDIAYFDGAGRIVAIQPMAPCPSADPSRCPAYPAGAAFYGAVEANRGWFAQNGIGVGDSVAMPGRVGS